jgi:hypothetical protein
VGLTVASREPATAQEAAHSLMTPTVEVTN